MLFELSTLSEPVKEILQRHVDRVMPLTRSATAQNPEEVRKLLAVPVKELFPGARHPEAALSGLFLWLNCWEESHTVSQDIASREGSYWHGIAHRIEPDSWNAGYWFRKMGKHPIFQELHVQAQRILDQHHASRLNWQLPPIWDPLLFIRWCEEARTKPASGVEKVALLIQQAEWQLLFLWCAGLTVEAIQ